MYYKNGENKWIGQWPEVIRDRPKRAQSVCGGQGMSGGARKAHLSSATIGRL